MFGPLVYTACVLRSALRFLINFLTYLKVFALGLHLFLITYLSKKD
jgi:hypothetical protein